jgi:hypothetical protein
VSQELPFTLLGKSAFLPCQKSVGGRIHLLEALQRGKDREQHAISAIPNPNDGLKRRTAPENRPQRAAAPKRGEKSENNGQAHVQRRKNPKVRGMDDRTTKRGRKHDKQASSRRTQFHLKSRGSGNTANSQKRPLTLRATALESRSAAFAPSRSTAPESRRAATDREGTRHRSGS